MGRNLLVITVVFINENFHSRLPGQRQFLRQRKRGYRIFPSSQNIVRIILKNSRLRLEVRLETGRKNNFSFIIATVKSGRAT